MDKKTSSAAKAAASRPLNSKQAKTRSTKAQKATLALRKQLWPDITDDMLWLRLDKTGFTTIPRTMPLFMELINEASKKVCKKKSVPAGKSYLVLWSRVFDEGVVKIDVETVAAREAGYTGERSTSTWREHLRVLKELGFIAYEEGPAGPFQYILLLNPYHVAKRLRAEGKVQKGTYTAIFQRALDIGATDLREDEDHE